MKNVFVLLLLTFTSLYAFCQKDTIIYYSKLGKVIDSQTKAQIYDQVKKATDTVCFLERYTNNNGKWIHVEEDKKLKRINDSTFLLFSKITSPTDTIYRTIKKASPGYIIIDHQNRFLLSIGYSRLIIPLIKEGKWMNYYSSTNKIKSEEEYTYNQMISNKRWKENGTEDIDNVFLLSDIDAVFQGGYDKLLHYLSTNVSFPGKSKRLGEKGTVTVQFVVMEDGSIDGVEILKGATALLDEESVRVVQSMPPWTPGLTNGKTVRVVLQVPFQYNNPIPK
jgi:TonB family protein